MGQRIQRKVEKEAQKHKKRKHQMNATVKGRQTWKESSFERVQMKHGNGKANKLTDLGKKAQVAFPLREAMTARWRCEETTRRMVETLMIDSQTRRHLPVNQWANDKLMIVRSRPEYWLAICCQVYSKLASLKTLLQSETDCASIWMQTVIKLCKVGNAEKYLSASKNVPIFQVCKNPTTGCTPKRAWRQSCLSCLAKKRVHTLISRLKWLPEVKRRLMREAGIAAKETSGRLTVAPTRYVINCITHHTWATLRMFALAADTMALQQSPAHRERQHAMINYQKRGCGHGSWGACERPKTGNHRCRP